MGRFSKFVSAETKAKSSTIVVNKYEIAENALEIMSKICSPKNEDDFGQYFDDIWEILYPEEGDSFRDFTEKDNDYKFWSYFVDYFKDLMNALGSHSNTNSTQVVVAGAFSSGKSTFLNTILGHNGLLPTGVEPVSIVNTFIYCSKNIKDVSVKGVNLKNVLVELDTDVLQCIQHASKSNVYLASVLDKLIIEYPANRLTEGLSFIDTPGYNKSDAKNDTNGKTDEETAMQALEKGDVLFWLVDIQDGTIATTGKAMINHFLEEKENGKVVIIFNKADKNSAAMKNIVQDTARMFNVSQDQRFIDVIAYSSSDSNIYYSFKGCSLEQVFQKVRSCSTGYSEVQILMDRIKWLFDNRIEWHENTAKDWTNELQKNKEDKNKWDEYLTNIEKNQKDDIAWLSKIILESYSNIKNAADRTYEVASTFRDNVVDCLNNGLFCYGSAQWGDGDAYDSAVNRTCKIVNSFMDKLNNACNYRFFEEDNRKAAVEAIKDAYEDAYKRYQTVYDEIRSQIDECQGNVDRENAYVALWQDYKSRIIRVLENGIAKANAEKKRRGAISATVKPDRPLDIFQAISDCDYSHFENCFTKGVSLNVFNSEGYSPLTYAVKTGQNDMVQYFINHNADLNAYDGRGYNAIQTAVENNYKDICQMLLNYDKSLVNTRSRKGEDLMAIARKNTFENWLSKKL